MYRIRRLESQVAREGVISKEQSRSAVPSESVDGRLTIQSRMDDVDSEIDAGCFDTTIENDTDMDAEAASSRMNDARSLASKQVH